LINEAEEDKRAAEVDLDTYIPLRDQTATDLADAETQLENK
jgi:hypothetical protein